MKKLEMFSGFRRDVDEICGLLGNYTTRRRVITQKTTDFKLEMISKTLSET
jgi:hypothetical protein